MIFHAWTHGLNQNFNEAFRILDQLITNNPKKRVGLMGYGLEIVENVAIEIAPNVHNKKYLETKRDKMGHEILK